MVACEPMTSIFHLARPIIWIQDPPEFAHTPTPTTANGPVPPSIDARSSLYKHLVHDSKDERFNEGLDCLTIGPHLGHNHLASKFRLSHPAVLMGCIRISRRNESGAWLIARARACHRREWTPGPLGPEIALCNGAGVG